MISHIKTMIRSEGEQWGRDEIYPDISYIIHRFTIIIHRFTIINHY